MTTLGDWRSMWWWPNDRQARILAGAAGHEREIVVAMDRDSFADLDRGYIPREVSEALKAELPAGWYLENRGTRIEVHPSGRFAGGFCDDDIAAVEVGLERLGLSPVVRVS